MGLLDQINTVVALARLRGEQPVVCALQHKKKGFARSGSGNAGSGQRSSAARCSESGAARSTAGAEGAGLDLGSFGAMLPKLDAKGPGVFEMGSRAHATPCKQPVRACQQVPG